MNLSKNLLILLVILSGITSFIFYTQETYAADCAITSASFSPSGTQPDSWYKSDSKPRVRVSIDFQNFQNCQGKTLEFSVVEEDDRIDDNIDIANRRQIIIQQNKINRIIVSMFPGEDKCDAQAGISDCVYYIKFGGTGIQNFNSRFRQNGVLSYDCEGLCFDDWQLEKIEQIALGPGPGGPGGPGPGQPGQPVDVSFNIENPIQAESLVDLAKAIGRFLFQIAIPIAVILIIWVGIMFLKSGGNPDKIKQAKQALLYIIIGLAVILIGQGFFTLIKSILNLGGPGP